MRAPGKPSMASRRKAMMAKKPMMAPSESSMSPMKKGGKAKLILPSSIAYGPNGNQAIHPYAPLTFDVELIDFKAAPTQTAMPKTEEKHNPNDGHSH